MVLSFYPYKQDILELASLNVAQGMVYYPKMYKDSKIKCAELITQVRDIEKEENRKFILQDVILQYSDAIYRCKVYE